MSVLKVDALHFIRTKKLKGGKVVLRSRKTIHNPKNTVTKNSGITNIAVEFDNKLAVGNLNGTLDTTNVEFKAVVESCELRGYLKGRGFTLMGYGLSANISNTNRRGE